MIRTLRATDLFRVLLDGKAIGPDWAQTWERLGTQPGSSLGPSAVARGLMLNRKGERYSVSTEGMHLRALASTKARSGPRAWEVQRLSLSTETSEDGVELLERLCMMAGQQGAERVFLRLSTSSPVVDVAKQAGFLLFTSEALYRLDIPPSGLSTSNRYIRPSMSFDEYGVFRLYCACAPAKVKAAYGLTFDEWRDARESPRVEERQGVYESQGCPRGWVRVTSHRRVASHMEVMLHPDEKSEVWEDLVAWGLQQGSPGSLFVAPVPEYQQPLASILEACGFAFVQECQLMVKSIAVRVNESALAPAGA
ncbi:MAG: hypothetical protein HYX93_03355 [Chloroflexi bacterium]|nr:hypothetical protein [Chloroflexota bacterium]